MTNERVDKYKIQNKKNMKNETFPQGQYTTCTPTDSCIQQLHPGSMQTPCGKKKMHFHCLCTATIASRKETKNIPNIDQLIFYVFFVCKVVEVLRDQRCRQWTKELLSPPSSSPPPMKIWAPLPKVFPQYNKLGSVRHVCELQGVMTS